MPFVSEDELSDILVRLRDVIDGVSVKSEEQGRRQLPRGATQAVCLSANYPTAKPMTVVGPSTIEEANLGLFYLANKKAKKDYVLCLFYGMAVHDDVWKKFKKKLEKNKKEMADIGKYYPMRTYVKVKSVKGVKEQPYVVLPFTIKDSFYLPDKNFWGNKDEKKNIESIVIWLEAALNKENPQVQLINAETEPRMEAQRTKLSNTMERVCCNGHFANEPPNGRRNAWFAPNAYTQDATEDIESGPVPTFIESAKIYIKALNDEIQPATEIFLCYTTGNTGEDYQRGYKFNPCCSKHLDNFT